MCPEIRISLSRSLSLCGDVELGDGAACVSNREIGIGFESHESDRIEHAATSAPIAPGTDRSVLESVETGPCLL